MKRYVTKNDGEKSKLNPVLTDSGVRIENCAGFGSIDEMLLQSHVGAIRLFPDWPKTGRLDSRT